jgi:hypothetical protein
MMKTLMRLATLTASFVLVAATAHAGAFLVTLDTSGLSGPQTLGFGLTNFDGSSNTVTLTDFDFDTGGAVAGSEDCTLGGTFSGLGCSGDLTSGVALTDLDPVAAFFTQQFTPGASLSFVLTATNDFGGGIPDQFSMFLCDAALSTCYSDDASGALLLLDLVGGSLSMSSFAVFGAADPSVEPPVVTAVPEPASLLLVGTGMIAAVSRRATRRRDRRACARSLRYFPMRCGMSRLFS